MGSVKSRHLVRTTRIHNLGCLLFSWLQCYGNDFQILECDGIHDTCMVLSMTEDSPADRSCSTYIGCKGAEFIDNDIISRTWNTLEGFLGEEDLGTSTPLRCCTSDLCNGAETIGIS